MFRRGVLIAFFIVSGVTFAASFQGLGDLPGGNAFSDSTAISADGSTVVGASSSANGYEAFRWTQQEGIQPLGDLPGGAFSSQAYDVSGDGSVVVGGGAIGDSSNPPDAFSWTSTGGMVALDSSVTVNGQTKTYPTRATKISNDGSVIVGYAGNPYSPDVFIRYKACYWKNNQMHLLTPPGYDSFSVTQAEAISADGKTIMISTFSDNTGPHCHLWSESGGFVELPTEGLPHLMSGDGMVVGGSGVERYSPSIWSEGKGTTMIGVPEGWDHNIIGCMNYDGSVVGGLLRTEEYFTSFDPQYMTAYLWDEENGVRLVEDILTGYGVNLDGWSLTTISDISADGMTICGNGINPDGFNEAWVATVPEPASLSLLLGGGLMLLRRGRQRIR